MVIKTTFVYNGNSADKQPGLGILEVIDSVEKQNMVYKNLSKIQNWRKMLTNSYPVDLHLDNQVWYSVDHYCCGKLFNEEKEYDNYIKFTKDNEYGQLTLNELKKVIAKHKKNYKVDESIMKIALRDKYSCSNVCLRNMLLETKQANLVYWTRGCETYIDDDNNKRASKNVISELLMSVRNELFQIKEEKNNKNEYNNIDESVIIQEGDDNNNNNVKEIKDATTILDSVQPLKVLTKKEIQDYNTLKDVYNPSLNKSTNILTIYEKTMILGIRMEQLAMGSDSFLTSNELQDVTSSVKDIALKELSLKKIPFILSRRLPDNKKEYWKLEDMNLCT